MKYERMTRLLCAALLLVQFPARAEDIDLFSSPLAGAGEAPNVLIILDNTANWSSPFVNEKAALVSVFNSLPVDRFNVGLMLFTETGSGNSNVDGAYVRAAIRNMTAANKTTYASLINSFNVIQDRSNSGKAGKAMEEAYRYYASIAPRYGNNKNKTDYTGNNTGTTQSNAVYALSGNALGTKAGTLYAGPDLANCAKNFVIWISNGAAQDSNADSTETRAQLAALGGNTTQLPISPSGSATNVADEWSRFMKESAADITTYTVDVNKVTTGQGPGWTALLKSMATVSGGKYFDVSSASNAGGDIAAALNTILSEILAVNSVFASVSLPASANTQSTFLNQVFIGMFRPDGNALPRWPGNLKQYKLGLDNGEIKLLDAANAVAINAQTGFVTECARSFWTPTTVDTYWAFSPQGACLAVANSNASNTPDGPVVEKGAQAYKLRALGPNFRTVRTCSPTFASCNTLVNFSTALPAATFTPAMFGAANATERDTLINWARGGDLRNEDLDAATAAEMRPSVHGDVVHSRPVAVNYGTDASPEVVVFYSGNDGMLRAINGNRDGGLDIGGLTPGSELWSFIPPEFLPNLKRLYSHPDSTTTAKISFPDVIVFPGEPAALPKPYGIDGPITAFKGTIDVSGTLTDKVFLYGGMRRGGRVLYAFDVTTPEAPVLKWKRGCPNMGNDTNCTSGWTQLGQTWSPAISTSATGYNSGASPLLIMGGGYDGCEDYDAQTAGGANHACTTPKGNGVFVIDADTGALLQVLSTERSVVGQVTVVPDSSGRIRYAYATDTGGNVYRISGGDAYSAIGVTAPGAWTITRIAALGCDDPSVGCTANRKFLFGPDVVDDSGVFSILVGSGDREKPLLYYSAANDVANYFFRVEDQPTNVNWLSDEAANCGGSSLMCLGSLAEVPATGDPDATEMANSKGWFIELADTEQVVTSAITVSNRVTFSTFQASTGAGGSCTADLGVANVYNINYQSADPISGDDRFTRIVGDGLPPSPVAGQVILDDGTIHPFLIGGSGVSPLEASDPSTTSSFIQPKSRVYWNIEK